MAASFQSIRSRREHTRRDRATLCHLLAGFRPALTPSRTLNYARLPAGTPSVFTIVLRLESLPCPPYESQKVPGKSLGVAQGRLPDLLAHAGPNRRQLLQTIGPLH